MHTDSKEALVTTATSTGLLYDAMSGFDDVIHSMYVSFDTNWLISQI